MEHLPPQNNAIVWAGRSRFLPERGVYNKNAVAVNSRHGVLPILGILDFTGRHLIGATQRFRHEADAEFVRAALAALGEELVGAASRTAQLRVEGVVRATRRRTGSCHQGTCD
jgi:hypothetical protein